MTDHVIIDAAERFAKKPMPPVDPLWTPTPDAIRRRAKGGKGSRSLLGAVHGYLDVLAEFIASQCRRPGPSAA